MVMKLCCVSVDVDGIDHYYGIHGLPAPSAAAEGLVHGLAVERLIGWAEEIQIPLTWFVIGRDTANLSFVNTLKAALDQGHELANHSQDHRYDLVRLAAAQQKLQIAGAQDCLEKAFGLRPVGFRAPGYTVSDALLDIVEQAGFIYDSSVFPCPVYYAAKALILSGQRIVGRRSTSILDSPLVLSAPVTPYRRGRPYTRRGSGLVEIPIQVTPWGRLPFIGTTLTSIGPTGARLLARSLVGVRLVNLELHAIDLLAADDGLHDLARHQTDLRLPLGRKIAALSAALDVFRKAGYAFVTMAEAVRRSEF
jgi:hypothetical protein